MHVRYRHTVNIRYLRISFNFIETLKLQRCRSDILLIHRGMGLARLCVCACDYVLSLRTTACVLLFVTLTEYCQC